MTTSNAAVKCLAVLTASVVLTITVLAGVATAGPLCNPPCQTELGEPTPGNTFLDAMIYRPVGLAAIPLGTALFVISLPFSATGGNVGGAFYNLVTTPVKYTFCRPLGAI